MANKNDWERLFHSVDKNKDGFLTAGELAREMINIGYPGNEGKIKAFLCATDRSGDRRLSKEEFMDSMANAPIEFQIAALCHSIFSYIDESGDGKISTEELKPALKILGKQVTDSQMDAIMSELDEDGSGSLDLKEFLTGINKHLI